VTFVGAIDIFEGDVVCAVEFTDFIDGDDILVPQ
jgi:hypothetical protein